MSSIPTLVQGSIPTPANLRPAVPMAGKSRGAKKNNGSACITRAMAQKIQVLALSRYGDKKHHATLERSLKQLQASKGKPERFGPSKKV